MPTTRQLDNRQETLKNLRGGQHLQTKGKLYSGRASQWYCCLGSASISCGLTKVDGVPEKNYISCPDALVRTRSRNTFNNNLPSDIGRYLFGMTLDQATVFSNRSVAMNDAENMTFVEIADAWEKYWAMCDAWNKENPLLSTEF